MNNKIGVQNIIEGNFAVTTVDGNNIFELINDSIEKQQKVVLDFSGVSIVTTAFLNAAIGQLYHKFNSDDIIPYLSLSNVEEEDLILFKKVIIRAKQYFSQKKS